MPDTLEKGQFGQPVLRCVLTVKNVPEHDREMWLEDSYSQVKMRIINARARGDGDIEVRRIMPITESRRQTVALADVVTYRPATDREAGG